MTNIGVFEGPESNGINLIYKSAPVFEILARLV